MGRIEQLRIKFPVLPEGAAPEARLLLVARGLRAFGDGLVSLILPVYLLALGYGAFEAGVLASATLAGSALLTLIVGLTAHRSPGFRPSPPHGCERGHAPDRCCIRGVPRVLSVF